MDDFCTKYTEDVELLLPEDSMFVFDNETKCYVRKSQLKNKKKHATSDLPRSNNSKLTLDSSYKTVSFNVTRTVWEFGK